MRAHARIGPPVTEHGTYESRYTAPEPKDPNADDDKLEATNYENSALFLVSCFQYILVAAVFSIGPPFRKQMWTNGAYLSCLASAACLQR